MKEEKKLSNGKKRKIEIEQKTNKQLQNKQGRDEEVIMK
jgi:hypothetical protein